MGFKRKRSKNFPKLPIRPADINRVTLQQDREFIMFTFYFSLFMVLLLRFDEGERILFESFCIPYMK